MTPVRVNPLDQTPCPQAGHPAAWNDVIAGAVAERGDAPSARPPDGLDVFLEPALVSQSLTVPPEVGESVAGATTDASGMFMEAQVPEGLDVFDSLDVAPVADSRVWFGPDGEMCIPRFDDLTKEHLVTRMPEILASWLAAQLPNGTVSRSNTTESRYVRYDRPDGSTGEVRFSNHRASYGGSTWSPASVVPTTWKDLPGIVDRALRASLVDAKCYSDVPSWEDLRTRFAHCGLGPGVQWTYPTDTELLNEVQTEYWLQEALHPNASRPDAIRPESQREMVAALKELAKPVMIDPQVAKFHGKSAFVDFESLRALTRGFGKDPDSMLARFREGGQLPMPVAIRHLDGGVEVLGGATRTGLAMLHGQRVQVLLLNESDTNARKMRLLLSEAEQLAAEMPGVFERTRAYFMEGAEKPRFASSAEAIAAYRVGLRLRSVANLLGVASHQRMELFKYDDIPDAFEAPAPVDIASKEFQSWFEKSQVVDGADQPLVVYHGSKTEISSFDPSATRDGGLHFGTEAQASMRAAGKSKVLVPVYLKAENLQRSRDTGGQWAKKIASAKAAGKDGIVYLNRYEGISVESILRAEREGVDLDRLTDAQFRRYVPEARDSFIVFQPTQVKSAVSNVGRFCPKSPDIHL